MMRPICALLLIALCVVHGPAAGDDDKQYILFTTIYRMTTEEELKGIMDNFKGQSPEDRVQVGISRIFDFLEHDPHELCKSMEKFLAAAEATNTPVLLKIDMEQFWGNRPDLWNWWDPEKPGYDPENRYNVDWHSWSPDDALKIAWRNWGRQFRVLPPPNLMSPAYRKAVNETFDIFLPRLLAWYEGLPEEKKYLFVGIVVGGETAIGYNAYYYPNGNDYLDKPEEEDPPYKFDRSDSMARGLVQLGYANVKTAGIRSRGKIREKDLVEVCRRHMESLSKHVREAGFEREKVFTHGVGNEQGELMYDAALNEYASPGWSAYWYMRDISRDTGIMRNIKKTDAKYWAIPESLGMCANHDEERWYEALVDALGYEDCKYICFNNWEGVITEQDGKPSRVVEATKRAAKALSE